MKRENGFSRDFWIKYDNCDLEKTKLCQSQNCICGRSLRWIWIQQCENLHFSPQNQSYITLYLQNHIAQIDEIEEFDLNKSKTEISKRLNSLNIDGLQCLLFLDVQQTDFIESHNYRKSQWHFHWHGFIKSNLPFNSLNSKLCKEFNPHKNKRLVNISPITKRPFSYDYLLKLITEHKRKAVCGIRGQGKRSYNVKGSQLRTLSRYYEKIQLDDCCLVIGFRRASRTLISTPRIF